MYSADVVRRSVPTIQVYSGAGPLFCSLLVYSSFCRNRNMSSSVRSSPAQKMKSGAARCDDVASGDATDASCGLRKPRCSVTVSASDGHGRCDPTTNLRTISPLFTAIGRTFANELKEIRAQYL